MVGVPNLLGILGDDAVAGEPAGRGDVQDRCVLQQASVGTRNKRSSTTTDRGATS